MTDEQKDESDCSYNCIRKDNDSRMKLLCHLTNRSEHNIAEMVLITFVEDATTKLLQ